MRRTVVTFTGFDAFWLDLLAEGLSRRYSDELECRSIVWPSTTIERTRFVRSMVSSDVMVRVGMPFEFESETTRVWLSYVRARRGLRAFNYWVGSDVFAFEDRARAGGLSDRDERAIRAMRHLAATENLMTELVGLGVPAEKVVLPSQELAVPDPPPPLPERFRVLSYWSDGRVDFYGGSTVLCAAERLPEIAFDIVGASGPDGTASPPNVTYHGRVSNMSELYARTTALVRLTLHDAVAAGMVEEALAFGRYVIYSFEWPHVRTVDRLDVEGLVRTLEELRDLHRAGQLPLNIAGRDFILEYWDPDARFAALRRAILGVPGP